MLDSILALFSTWNLIRLSGFLALFFITFSAGFGMLSKVSWLKKKKALTHSIHLTSAWGSVLALLFHFFLLMVDTYRPFTIKELLVPFSADYAPFAAGLGTVAFYLMMTIYLSSDFGMKKLKRKTWKSIHWLAVPAWILSLAHGIVIGTDSSTLWAMSYYLCCIFFLLLIGLFRASQTSEGKPNQTKVMQKPTIKSVRSSLKDS